MLFAVEFSINLSKVSAWTNHRFRFESESESESDSVNEIKITLGDEEDMRQTKRLSKTYWQDRNGGLPRQADRTGIGWVNKKEYLNTVAVGGTAKDRGGTT